MESIRDNSWPLLLSLFSCHAPQAQAVRRLVGSACLHPVLPYVNMIPRKQLTPACNVLLSLLQIGFPLQYNQYPLLRALWNIRFLAQVVAHKLLPFLISPPLFLMIQDPQQSYSSVLAATERSRRMLYVIAAALVAGVAWLLQKLFVKAAGGA